MSSFIVNEYLSITPLIAFLSNHLDIDITMKIIIFNNLFLIFYIIYYVMNYFYWYLIDTIYIY